jgi:hypothetical protein
MELKFTLQAKRGAISDSRRIIQGEEILWN